MSNRSWDSPRSRWAATSAWLLRDRCLGDVQTTVLAHCRRYARAILVTANTALAIAIAPSALAQDAPGPPWWYGWPLPDEPTGTLLIQNVQRTPASAFDPQLPPIPFDAWLWVTLAPVVEFVPERVRRDQQLAEWRVRYCPDITSAIPHASSPELCVNGTVALSAEKQVKIVIAVADGVRGVTDWKPSMAAETAVATGGVHRTPERGGSTRSMCRHSERCRNCSTRPSSSGPPWTSRARSLGPAESCAGRNGAVQYLGPKYRPEVGRPCLDRHPDRTLL